MRKLAEMRKRLGLTQVEFAVRLGVHQSMIGALESGRVCPSLLRAVSYEQDLIGRPIDWRGDGDEPIEEVLEVIRQLCTRFPLHVALAYAARVMRRPASNEWKIKMLNQFITNEEGGNRTCFRRTR